MDALAFTDHFWEFEDDRPMYLMFNNYGYNLSNTLQLLHGGVDWRTIPKPEPLCFAFRSRNSFARMTPAPHHIEMVVKYEHLIRHTFSAALNPELDVLATFLDYEVSVLLKLRCQWGAGGYLQALATHAEAAALGARNEFDSLGLSPRACIHVTGRDHSLEFMSGNYEDIIAGSLKRGLVHRVKKRISQHLCAPILNPDLRLGCIAPLNHDTRPLPPEMRDFVLRMTDVNFDFLETTEPVEMNEIVLSEFNGGVQDIATSESLLYLPNFMEFTTTVQADLTFSKDCYSGTGVPAFLCVFCRDGPVLAEQPLITTLSLQNRTTMKKSDTVFDTDIHELYHMTQRNVHHRSEYESTAFNKRQTILLASEDVGIMGMDPADNYQRQKRVVIRVSGTSTRAGKVTVLFVYNNRGLYLTGVQQSVVRL